MKSKTRSRYRILLLATSLYIVLMLTSAPAQLQQDAEQYRKMVIAELKAQGTAADSVGAALLVTGYGNGVDDFILIPVMANGKVVAVYRDDSERSSVTQIASTLVLRSVQATLFEEQGAIEVFAGLKIKNPKPHLISCGPFSLFGALGSGWYQATGNSFVLLAFNGRIVNESEVSELFPDRVDLLKSIAVRDNKESTPSKSEK